MLYNKMDIIYEYKLFSNEITKQNEYYIWVLNKYKLFSNKITKYPYIA